MAIPLEPPPSRPPPRPPRQPRGPSSAEVGACQARAHIEATLTQCLREGGRAPGAYLGEAARMPVLQSNEGCYEDGSTAISLKKISDSWATGAPLALYCDPAQRQNCNQGAMLALAKMCVEIGTEVFGFSEDGCRRTFRIAWELSERIAFNKCASIAPRTRLARHPSHAHHTRHDCHKLEF